MGLSLSLTSPHPFPREVCEFLTTASRPGRVTIYMDGSFELVQVLLIYALTQTSVEKIARYGRGATGIYVPPTADCPALALQLITPPGRANAWSGTPTTMDQGSSRTHQTSTGLD
jgi:hypothetical protein